MIRRVTDDWLFLLSNGPLTIPEMVDITHNGKETVYRAMLCHEKRGYVCRLMGAWKLDDAGKARVEKLTSETK